MKILRCIFCASLFCLLSPLALATNLSIELTAIEDATLQEITEITVNEAFTFEAFIEEESGEVDALNVSATITIPAAITIDSVEITRDQCTTSDQTVTCSVGTVAAGDSFTVSVHVTGSIESGEEDPFDAQAEVIAENEIDESNNSDTTSIYVGNMTILADSTNDDTGGCSLQTQADTNGSRFSESLLTSLIFLLLALWRTTSFIVGSSGF